jgi:hypothetical protein
VVIIFLALIWTITAYFQLETRPGNPSGRAGGADHHGIPGSGTVLSCARTAVVFRQAPGHARGFRAGNYLAVLTKIFLLTG